MTDRVVLVDADDRPLGTADKLEAHTEGWLHRAFSVFVFDPEGRLLLQQRHSGKYHSGGLWSNACCSHPRPGESVAAAAQRRMVEELGFACDVEPAFGFRYEATVGPGLTEHEYDHVFVATAPATTPMTPHPDEVDAVAWVAPDELCARVDERPDAYTVWFRMLLPRVLEEHTPASVS